MASLFSLMKSAQVSHSTLPMSMNRSHILSIVTCSSSTLLTTQWLSISRVTQKMAMVSVFISGSLKVQMDIPYWPQIQSADMVVRSITSCLNAHGLPVPTMTALSATAGQTEPQTNQIQHHHHPLFTNYLLNLCSLI